MIVLAPLIVFVCLLVVMVVAGKLIYGTPRGIYRTEATPRLEYALAPAPVYEAGRVVSRLESGDSAWIVRLDNGSVAVFRDPAGEQLVGVAEGLFEPAR
jgi:hypothetical protein